VERRARQAAHKAAPVTREARPLAADYLPLLREALDREGRFRLPLRGNSMLPTLPAACEIEVEPLAGEPALGALLVFALGDALVAHRLVRRKGGRLVCQGDNRRAPDSPLRPEQVLGRVVAAWADGARLWPGPADRARSAWWVARAWGWAGARRAHRFARGTTRPAAHHHHE
jgi:hypothetical protein